MSARPRTAVVLFTRDLRFHDQPCLHAAAAGAERILPLFVLDERLLPRRAANRLAFLLEALADLRAALRARGGDLVVRRGDAVREAVRAARAVGAAELLVAADVTPRAHERELRLAEACRREHLRLRVLEGASVAPPGELAPAGRSSYRVFTPYWRRWREQPLRNLLTVPERLALPDGVDPGSLPSLRDLTSSTPSPERPRGGESEGRRRLARWVADGLARYEAERGRLDREGTSRLSPYLHFGCLSPVEVARAARAAGALAFERQLCWRDFFLQLYAAAPEAARAGLRPPPVPPRRDAEALARWEEGRTGYPVIDAAMAQLRREGWMHNRARLLVASFLTKTLGLDWRDGARLFFELLADGDAASNAGNWQWAAGAGADPRPRRIFDPTAQAQRLDPDGAYVRRYLPELESIPGAAVHEPWQLPRSRCPRGYPAPMVDHRDAARAFRERTRAPHRV